MTRQEFLQLLQENNINERILFDGELGDGSGARKNRTGWEVYHQERGSYMNLSVSPRKVMLFYTCTNTFWKYIFAYTESQ